MENHPLEKIELAALVGLGGFMGAIFRHLAATLTQNLYGTLTANTIGCLLMGFLVYESIHHGILSDESHNVLATGFMASFTTFSTFIVQTISNPGIAILNIVANLSLGITAVYIGRTAALSLERWERWY